MPKHPNSFDHSQHDFYEQRRLMERSAELTHKNFKATKRHAYRTAAAFVAMQHSEPNRLMELIRNEVGAGSDLVNRFIEKTFAPLASIGEDFSELITAIHENMTEREYLSQSPSAFLASKRSKSNPEPVDVTLPPRPLDDMTAEEQVAHWRTRALAAEQKMRRLEEQVSELSRDCAKLRRQNKELHRLVSGAKR